jgi:hypothetical protein
MKDQVRRTNAELISKRGCADSLEGVAFFHDPLGRLVFRNAAGDEHHDVTPVRSFPVSDPEYGISICDAQGCELLWIERLSALPQAVRESLQIDLAQREFLPILIRIASISANSEPCEWEVETDRGRTKFVLKTDEDVRRIDQRRAMVTDANGVEYLIPDLAALDATSRKYLERYL